MSIADTSYRRIGREPAFARAGSEDRTNGDMPDGNYYEQPADGLTKREYMATHILAGIWANPHSSSLERGEAANAAADQAELLLEALEAK